MPIRKVGMQFQPHRRICRCIRIGPRDDVIVSAKVARTHRSDPAGDLQQLAGLLRHTPEQHDALGPCPLDPCTQTSVRLHVVRVVDAGKPVSDTGIPKLWCARPVTRLILGITMGAQPPLGVPGQVRLVAGSEFDLENLVRTQSGRADGWSGVIDEHEGALQCLRMTTLRARTVVQDRKSTRLNSSHSQISYAVFCLKKKKTIVSSYPTL